MAAIILQDKWRSQPSGPTPADRARFPTLKHLWGGVKVFGGGSGQPGWWNAAGQANAVFGSGSGGNPSGNTWVTAPFGHVTNFDNTGTGTESSVVIALGDSSGSGAPSGTNFTVFVTVNLSSVTGTQCLYGAGNSGIEVRSNGTGLELLKSGVASMHTSSMGLSAGAWHRLAISYDGATVSAYRDGRLISSGSSSQTFAHSQQYRSGGRTLDALDDRIKNGGKIGVLAVFDSCLSGSEIAEVSSNEWALYRKQPRILYFNTAGGGASISGALESISLATFGATVGSARDVAATLESLALTTSAARVSSDRAITASVEAIIITTSPARIASDRAVAAATEQLTVAPATASVALVSGIAAGTEALSVTANPATVALAASIAATLEAITVTGLSATVSAGSDNNISATLESITVTVNPATVSRDSALAAALESLTVTPHAASIAVGQIVAAALESLTLTSYPAGIALDVAVAAQIEQINLATFAAQVGLGTNVAALTEALTLTPHGATLTFAPSVGAARESITVTTFTASVIGGESILTTPGLEFTIPLNRLGYTIPIGRIHFTIPQE